MNKITQKRCDLCEQQVYKVKLAFLEYKNEFDETVGMITCDNCRVQFKQYADSKGMEYKVSAI